MKAISPGLKVLYCQRNGDEQGAWWRGWGSGRGEAKALHTGGGRRGEAEGASWRLWGSRNTLVGGGCGPKSLLLPPASVQAQRDIIRTNSARTKPGFRVCSLDPTRGEVNILALR